MFNLGVYKGSVFLIYLLALMNWGNNENGHCEDLCISIEGFVTCGCRFINETLYIDHSE